LGGIGAWFGHVDFVFVFAAQRPAVEEYSRKHIAKPAYTIEQTE